MTRRDHFGLQNVGFRWLRNWPALFLPLFFVEVWHIIRPPSVPMCSYFFRVNETLPRTPFLANFRVATIQNQSASKHYGDALPYPRPVYSATGISKELRISSIYG